MYGSQEEQQYEQDIQRQAQFEDWFHGPEIQGDVTAAVHFLAEKIGKICSMDSLMEAFFYVEPKPIVTPSSSSNDLDDDLPF